MGWPIYGNGPFMDIGSILTWIPYWPYNKFEQMCPEHVDQTPRQMGQCMANPTCLLVVQ